MTMMIVIMLCESLAALMITSASTVVSSPIGHPHQTMIINLMIVLILTSRVILLWGTIMLGFPLHLHYSLNRAAGFVLPLLSHSLQSQVWKHPTPTLPPPVTQQISSMSLVPFQYLLHCCRRKGKRS